MLGSSGGAAPMVRTIAIDSETPDLQRELVSRTFMAGYLRSGCSN
jgi:hypothetical protein